jgi:hypothetical protein
MWTGLVAMKTWIRDRGAPATASAAASTSSGVVRASEATVGRSTARATARTPSNSPGLDDVDSEPLELPRDRRLLVRAQRDPRRLLAIAQRGIEDGDPAG